MSRGQPECDEQLDDLPDALPGPAEEGRIGCQPEIHADKVSGDVPETSFGAPRNPWRMATLVTPIPMLAAAPWCWQGVLHAGVAERLGSGLQSRPHGFESRHSLISGTGRGCFPVSQVVGA